jgi:hypothetical protein
MPGMRAVEIMRAYVNAFVHLHPRHRPQHLLDGPSPRLLEVDFV